MQTYTPTELEAAAAAAVELFRAKYGISLLKALPVPGVLPEERTIRKLAESSPGQYTSASVFTAVMQRTPTHSEVVKTGHLLGRMGFARTKAGPTTLWLLDERSRLGAN